MTEATNTEMSLEKILVEMGIKPTVVKTILPERYESYLSSLREINPERAYYTALEKLFELHKHLKDPLRAIFVSTDHESVLYMEELRLAREVFAKKDPATAYNLFVKVGDEFGLRSARERLIETHPRRAFNEFDSANDIDGLDLLSKIVAGTNPAVAYDALKRIKSVDAELLSRVRAKLITDNPEAAVHCLGVQDKEGLSTAGRKLIAAGNLWEAYDALIRAEDAKGLELVRERMVGDDLDRALATFSLKKDRIGQVLAGRSLISRNPKSAYEYLVRAGDKEAIKITRTEFMEKDPNGAYNSIIQNHEKDFEGLDLISGRFIEENPGHACFIFGRMVGYEKELRAAREKLVEVEPARAYGYAMGKIAETSRFTVEFIRLSKMRLNSLERLMDDDPAKAYSDIKSCKDEDGFEILIDYLAKRNGVEADKLRRVLPKIKGNEKETESVMYDYHNRPSALFHNLRRA